MKDMFGKNIEVGNHVAYVVSAFKRHLEKAIVTESGEAFIKIEYLGVSSSRNSLNARKIGGKSRLTATDKKVIILDGLFDDGVREVYKDERKRFEEEIKKIKSKLKNVLEREKHLAKKNEKLQEEVDKINNRFDILDL